MAACTPDLTKVSMLSPLGFRLTINAEEFRNVEYFCIAAQLPAVSLPEIEVAFRNMRAPQPGETIQYSPLPIIFIVDEELANYIEIYNWIYNNAHSNDLMFRDMTLSILTNKNTSNRQIIFKDAMPTTLTPIDFNSQDTSIPYVTASVDFAYSSFDIV